MKIPRPDERHPSPLNLTSLIDMLFILIVFFLATSRFQQDERDESIELVQSKSELPLATASQHLVIEIDREGRKKVHGEEKSLEELEAIVKARIEIEKESEIIIRADRRALVGHLQEATEICHRLGMKTPRIAYFQG